MKTAAELDTYLRRQSAKWCGIRHLPSVVERTEQIVSKHPDLFAASLWPDKKGEPPERLAGKGEWGIVFGLSERILASGADGKTLLEVTDALVEGAQRAHERQLKEE